MTDITERAAWNLQLAVADYYVAVKACRTTDDAVRLSELIQESGISVDAALRAARLRADELSGASR